MVSDHQGVRSSRTGSIRKRDRLRMRKLDRAIARLDRIIWVFTGWHGKGVDRAVAKRSKLDQTRKQLRHWMKDKGTTK